MAIAEVRVEEEILNVFHYVSGMDIDRIDRDANFFEMGFDSIMMGRASHMIKKRFAIELSLEMLYTELNTVSALIAHLRAQFSTQPRAESQFPLPAALQQTDMPEQLPLPGAAAGLEPSTAGNNNKKHIIEKQLKIMEMQLELLGNKKNLRQHINLHRQEEKPKPVSIPKAGKAISTPNVRAFKFTMDHMINPQQQRFIEDFTRRYNKRTNGSKQYTRQHREQLCDWVNSLNFRLSLKEVMYPIVEARSSGSRIWDIDGNEYIDLAMGYGVSFFGNKPEFITRAIEEQMALGYELGPQTPLAGEVAQLICELTGVERVTFCNTGSEAVMMAIRAARTKTGRQKIVFFSGSFHGTCDSVMAIKVDDGNIVPAAAGISPNMIKDAVVLDYGTAESLDYIKSHLHELAAVLVEPVQSRRPDFQPAEFLRELAELTANSNTALIFDEMITGFRIHPGGAQAYFGVRADIVTYGKIVGGGMPIGIVAGKARYLDTIDGGMWNYGDKSYPPTTTTFFGGTFCKHPLTLAAVKAVLLEFKKSGPAIQQRLNRMTDYFVNTINTFFEEEEVPFRVAHFASQFLFTVTGMGSIYQFKPLEYDLLFYLLMEKGIYTWERKTCFFSTAISEEDVEYVINAIKESITELRRGGFTFGRDTDTPVPVPVFPMSSIQQRLFVLSRLEGGEEAYHLTMATIITGPLDVKKLGAVFKRLVQRHESLRTGFELRGSGFVQRVREHMDFSIIYKQRPGTGSTGGSIESMVQEFIRPFDLSEPPLMRIGVTELAPHRHLLMMDTHHTVTDGLSVSILFREMMNLYRGKNIPPVEVQYRDFVTWEQKYLDSDEFKTQERYWLAALSGQLPRLHLPMDFPRPSRQSFAGATLHFQIGMEKTAALRKMAGDTSATLYMVLLAAFNILLYKLSGQEDIMVGTPAEVREHGDFENTIGMFTNTIVLRNNPAGDKSFPVFLEEVKHNSLNAYSNREYPFASLVEKVGAAGDAGRNPLFDVQFVYENAEERVLKLENLTFTHHNFEVKTSLFDLTFEVIKEQGRLNINLNYNTKLFKQATIKKWQEYFEKITGEILRDQDILPADIELLSDGEKHKILVEFNATRTGYPKDKTIHRLFEEQAEQTPDNIAVVGVGTRFIASDSRKRTIKLTYKELNKKSDQLAHPLIEKGVRPGTIVGIMVERSVEMIIGILGILKAGGAYLPIDPDYPEDRINYMLADSNAKILVTIPGLSGKLKKLSIVNCQLLMINENPPNRRRLNNPPKEANSINNYQLTIYNLQLKGNNLVYVIYTSGSTGKPKGVMIEHRAVVNFIKGITDVVEFKADDSILSLTTICFDIFGLETFLPLAKGTKIFIGSREEQADPAQSLRVMERENITIFQSTPSRLLLLVSAEHAGTALKRLKNFLVGGETFPPGLLEKVRNISDGNIYNVFGPTETTIWSTIKDVTGDKALNIGKPIANTRIYILDRFGTHQPVGVPGELIIGGDGLARGYLNQPETTAEKFVYFYHRSYRSYKSYISKKIYRTGDLARWLPDGNIEFLGRIDFQVKIRGYRVELGEIENALLKHENIKETVVVAKKDKDGTSYLSAYIVPVPDGTQGSDYRDFLSKRLPGYMIPSFFVPMEALPLTPGGKIDRKALPEPGASVQTGLEYQAPSTGIEIKLLEIWREGLGIERIGINDSFFKLGGHSLKAIILVSKIKRNLQVDIPLQVFFEKSTIKAQAEYIEHAETCAFAAVESVEKREYYPVSAAQRRLFALSRFDQKGISYNMLGALLIEGDPSITHMEQVFKTLIARHESLRTSFRIIDGQPVQEVHEKVDFKIETGTHHSSFIIHHSFVRPFDLSQAPLLRVGLMKKEDKKHILLFDMHHIISDGVSTNILIREFNHLYAGRELTELPVQYKEFAAWQNGLFQLEQVLKQKAYWVEKFSNEIPVLNMPWDFRRPAVQSFDGNHVEFEMDEELTGGLKRIAANIGATLYMVLLSVYNILLSKYSGQYDLVVGSPTAGRRHADLENIIGMFVNTLAMRNFPEPGKSFEEFLKEVKFNSLEAFENQDYQFDELVENLDINKDVGRNPLFDTLFGLQNPEAIEVRVEGLEFKPYELESKVSKFDMALRCVETDDKIEATLEYCVKLFKKETVLRFAGHLVNIVKEIVANPGIKLGRINMLSAEEENRLLYEFNATKTDYPKDKAIHGLFREQVKQTPDNIAIVGPRQSKNRTYMTDMTHISYRQSNEKADRLSGALREKGVRSDTVVAIMAERSTEMIIGILGILKAGGAYLPIDPDYPEDRINYMLADSDTKILLTSDAINRVPTPNHLPLHLSTLSATSTSTCQVSPANLAYVIYTSGAAGRPAAVLAEHINVVRLVKNTDYIGFQPQDRLLQTGAIDSAAPALEIWGPLLNGACLVLAAKETILNQEELNVVVKRNNISVLRMTSPQFNRVSNLELFAGLKNLLAAGDTLSPHQIDRVQKTFPALKIINGYGPAENTTLSTTYLVTDKHRESDKKIPIGRPIANSSVYIVDKSSMPVPVHVPGELLVGGDGVSRGYMNQPELTAEKFDHNKKFLRGGPGGAVFSKSAPPGRRRQKLYKTGDLARWLPDGNIDRKVLPEPRAIAQTGMEHQDPYPSIEMETKLVKIWQEVLQVERIGINDNFFELGGHSLEAIILVSKIERDFQVELALAILFEKPTIKEQAKYIQQLETRAFAAVKSIEKQEYYPVSAAQKRLFALNRFDPGGASYNTPGAMLIKGELSTTHLEQVFKTLIARHESLRTSFHLIDGQPVQEIHEDVEFRIEYYDLYREVKVEEGQSSHSEGTRGLAPLPGAPLSEESHPSSVIRHLSSEFVRSFDLSRAPLLRLQLVKQEEKKHILLFDMHHIISDGTSRGIFVREFNHLYAGGELKKLLFQYKEFALWQKELFQSEQVLKQKLYWVEKFSGEIPVLSMLTDFPRPAVQNFEGNTIEFKIEEELSEGLRRIAADNGVTMYMVLLAVYGILLSKYSGQDDIIVGTPTAGRRHQDLENIIGMFVNTLVMRNYPRPGKPFKAFLKEVKSNSLEAFENQDYQFDDLVEHLDLTRDVSRNPLFDTMFSLHNLEEEEVLVEGLEFKPYNLENKVSKFDITLQCMENNGKINAALEYCVKLFKKETMSRFAGHFLRIAREIVDTQGMILLEDIKLLTPGAEKEMILDFNNITGDFVGTGPGETIQSLFQKQVNKTPDNTALEYEDRQLTYKEIQLKSDAAVRFLAHRGIKKETVIGIFVNHRIEFISILVGILEAGCIFMPLDPTLPLKRIRRMLETTNTGFVFSDALHYDQLAVDTKEKGLEIIPVNGDFYKQAASLPVSGSQAAAVGPGDMIYIYFTSGTTGMPKAIVGKNKSLRHFITWEIETFGIDGNHRVSQFTAMGFDAFLRDLFVPLCTGGRVCIPGNEDLSDSGKIIRWIDTKGIHLIHCVPSFFRLLNTVTLSSGHFKALKYILLSGEPINPGELKNWYGIFGDRIGLVNFYGPTETTMIKTYHIIKPSDTGKERIPAGIPLKGTKVIILDKKMNICDRLITGEIYIKTPYRTYGYCNDPQSTNGKFIANPFANDRGGGDLIYKTGDLGRLLPDNTLEILGRIDQQVKIRGARVELGEIEDLLLNHKKIKNAAVTSRQCLDKNNHLCAYYTTYTPHSDERETVKELTEYLSDHLPAYMIPEHFILMEKLPLTVSGKVDRKALPDAQGVSKKQKETEYQAPITVIDKKIAAIWREVLDMERVGINDNFFSSGGNSLKALALISKIKKNLHVELPLALLFKEPSIRGISSYIVSLEKVEAASIELVEEKDYYPVSAAQGRLFALNRFDPDSVVYNMPGALRIQGDLSIMRLEQVLKMLIARHEALRTSFHLIDGQPVQKVHEDVEFKIEYDDMKEVELKEKRSPILEGTRGLAPLSEESHLSSEFIRPFDLSQPPLLRVKLIKEEDKKYFLLFDMHHIISDGVTMTIFVKEFNHLYAHREPAKLPFQYKDFAAYQEVLFQSEQVLKQKVYWVEKFSAELPVLNMPLDFPRPSVQSFQGDRARFEIDEELCEGLRRIAADNGATLYMVLLSVYSVLLSKYSGQDDIVVGSPTAGRRHAGLENIIGLFINTLAMRNYPRPGKSFREFLTEVTSNSLEAFENQDYQFDDLVEHLYLTRDVSRNPLFDTMFALHNLEDEEVLVEGLEFKPYELEKKISRFDITLQCVENNKKIDGLLEYSVKLFKKETMARFAAHFLNTAKEIVEKPGIKLSQINMLSTDEQNRLLYEFNAARCDYPKDKTIHRLFREQAEGAPGHIAVIGPASLENRTHRTYMTYISYRELDKRADRLAALLTEKGVGPDTTAGLMMERSVEMIIALLGILKAGGAYMPIDPDYPEERIKYMLKDSNAKILLKYNDFIPQAFNNRPKGTTIHPSTLLPFYPSNSSSLAYIIYTSGSTGRPKGVMVTHKNVAALVINSNYMDYCEEQRLLMTGSLTFDVTTFEIWGALLNGLNLYVAGKDIILDSGKLNEIVTKNKITILHLIPQLFNHVVDQCPGMFAGLEYFLIGGDMVRPEPINRLRNRYRDLKIIHCYGPTENTTFSTYLRVDTDYQYRIPIGVPISNSTVYILDRWRNPQPIGVMGELYTGGEGVARGYLNRPELTKERFCHDLWDYHDYQDGYHRSYRSYKSYILYKSGDLARWLPDGNIEFLGRIDSQVKIRGIRIELGEIEKVLLQHPHIEDCAAVLRDTNDDKQLAVYYKKRNRVQLWPSLAEYFVYDDLIYLSMLQDEARNEKYRSAINKVIKGKTVLEIGPGSEAILARMCIEGGAKKVYAVEKLEEAAQKAHETVKKLGLENRIIVIHGDILDVKLPEQVDYCVSEIVGSIGGSEGAAKIINAARAFLEYPSCMIPARGLTKIAAITLPPTEFDASFEEVGAHYVEKVFHHVGHRFDLRLCLYSFPGQHVISNADVFEDLNFTRENLLEDQHEIYLEIQKSSILNGFILWLNLFLDNDVLIDSLENKYIWLPIYLPIFWDGEPVEKGDHIRAEVIRKLSKNNINPDFIIKGQLHKKRTKPIDFIYQCPHINTGYKGNSFYKKVFSAPRLNITGKITAADLKKFLSSEVPDYMVPSFFVPLEKFPLTASGKVDRKALPEPGKSMQTGTEYLAPAAGMEILLANVWQEVLGIERVGINDNFFESGGHSLKAIQIISKLQNKHINVRINDIFMYQTIKELANYLSGFEKNEDKMTMEETEKALKQEYQKDAVFIKYHVDRTVYIVLYVEGPLMDRLEEISEFSKRCLPGKSCPHYIRPLSLLPPGPAKNPHMTPDRFSQQLQLKKVNPAAVLPAIFTELEKDEQRYNQTITHNPITAKYKISAVQQINLTIENRSSGTMMVFDNTPDYRILEKALLLLIKRQGLLRSILVKETENESFMWQEYEAPVNQHLPIPYVDVSTYHITTRKQIVKEIISKEFHRNFPPGKSLLYRMVFIKINLRKHLLILPMDHAIFDAMSGEIIERNLREYYHALEKGKEIPGGKTIPYAKYIQQINKGPQNITGEELVKRYDLENYAIYKRKVEKIIKNRENETQGTYFFNYEIKLDRDAGTNTGINEDKAWETAFTLFTILVKRYFDLPRVPVKIMSYGRRYQDKNYFDTVGEFLDAIPVLVTVDEKNPHAMIEYTRDRIETASKHGINFAGLLYNPELNGEWRKIVKLIFPETLEQSKLMIVFDFKGKEPEEERNLFKLANQGEEQAVLDRDSGKRGRQEVSSSFMCNASYTSTSIYLNVGTTIEPDVSKFKKILDEVKDQVWEAKMPKYKTRNVDGLTLPLTENVQSLKIPL